MKSNIISTTLLGVLTIALFLFNRVNIVVNILIMLSFVAIFLAIVFLKREKRKLYVLFLLLSSILYLLSNTIVDAPLIPSLISSFALSFPLLFVPVLINKRGVYISLLLSLPLWLSVKYYLNTYLYIFSSVDNIKRYEILFLISYLALILSLVALLFPARKNYLSRFLLINSMLVSLLNSSSNGLLLLFMLIIVIINEKDRTTYPEERNIKFEKLIYEEVPKLRIKKKEVSYPIPPNVPKKNKVETKDTH